MTSWRTWLAGLLAVMTAALASGCGGGGDGGTPIVGGAQPSDLALVLSSATISNTGAQTVTATVTALDANRNAVPNASVQISVDANATVQVSSSKTASDGTLVGTIGIGSDQSIRKITVTATSGSIKRTAELLVVEGGSNGTPKAADLTLVLSSLTLPNSGTQTITATVTAVDANRNTISGVPVTFAVDQGATIKMSGTVTDSDGHLSGAVGIGDDQTNRTITVTATTGTIVRVARFQVTGAQIKTTLLPPAIGPGQAGKVQLRVADVNGNPVPNKTITITGPGPVQASGTSDINGDYEYNYTAPATPGEYVVRVSAIGVESLATLLVTSGSIPEVTDQVQAATVSANPSVVPINRTGQTNQATIRALFLAAANKPIKNMRVRFDLDDDKQSIGGSFTSAGTIVYSDANGVATTSYIPASRFSPTDGVTVRACWDYRDFAAGSCPNATRTTLTVISDALSVSIGTNGLITFDDNAGDLTYTKRYAVQVVDSSGLAVSDVLVSASVDLLQYGKGFWVPGRPWTQTFMASCDNEDVNRNGVADVYSNGDIEDANKSFNNPLGRPALDPRKADVALSFEGSNKTNTSGIVVLKLVYPQNLGSWVKFNLVVSASGVAGSEGRADFISWLQVPAKHIEDPTKSPPFQLSPYGIEGSPLVVVSEPGSIRPPSTLCTNKD